MAQDYKYTTKVSASLVCSKISISIHSNVSI